MLTNVSGNVNSDKPHVQTPIPTNAAVAAINTAIVAAVIIAASIAAIIAAAAASKITAYLP